MPGRSGASGAGQILRFVVHRLSESDWVAPSNASRLSSSNDCVPAVESRAELAFARIAAIVMRDIAIASPVEVARRAFTIRRSCPAKRPTAIGSAPPAVGAAA
ncbi:MAG TPA: hypothetical protein VMF13_06500 [Luteitalea sp.]|nr:hypothetical protein [Luteitalea sp.]